MSTYTSNLNIQLIGTGEQAGTWGTTTNGNWQYVMEEAIVGRVGVSFSDADVTLTATAATTDQSYRNLYLNCTGTNTASRNLVVPTINKTYVVENNTTGGFSIVVKTSAGTGITVPNGVKAALYVDGTNVVTAFNYFGATTFSSITDSGLTSGRVTYATTGGLLTDSANLTFNGTTLTANTLNLTNALGTAYGGTGLTSFTSGGVVYASSSSALATGSAFIWTGGTAQLGFQNAAANGYAYIGNAGAGTNTDLAFYMGATEGMRLTSTGLGIGTSSPTNIQGDNSKLLTYSSTAGTLSVTSGGYVNSQYAQLYLSGGYGDNGFVSGYYIRSQAVTPYGAASDATLQFFAAVRGSAPSKLMELTSSGNLGLGVTPSAWGTYKGLQVGGSAALWGPASTGAEAYLNANTYYNGTNRIYISTNSATEYSQAAGVHSWKTATSGTAGTAITFTQAMTLDTSGRLGIGTTSPSERLTVVGVVKSASATQSSFYLSNAAQTNGFLLGRSYGSDDAQNFFIYDTVASATRLYIDSSGNLGLGTSSPAYKLDVNGTSKLLGNVGVGGNPSASTNIPLYVQNASGLDTQFLLTTTGVNNTVMGFNNSGSTNGQGVPNNTVYFGSLNTYPVAITNAGNLVATFSTAGNLGLGVTPSAWSTSNSTRAIQISSVGSIWGNVNSSSFNNNWYLASGDVSTYISTAPATRYVQDATGIHQWFYAASGTAGATMTLSEAMRIDTSGNLGIGTTSPSGYTLHVSNSNPAIRISNTSETAGQTQALYFGTTTYNRSTIQSINVGTAGANLAFLTAPSGGSPTERARIDSSGNLLVGTTTAAGPAKLTVSGITSSSGGTTSQSTTVTTSFVTIATQGGGTTAGFAVVTGYQTTSGNQGVWLVTYCQGTVTVVSSTDNTLTVPSFQMSSYSLQMKTTTNTLAVSCSVLF